MARRSQGRRTQKRVLIVCEGETESCYFEGFRLDRRLGSLVTIRVEGDSNTIVREAEKYWKRALQDKDPYDLVCCIFDCDGRNYIAEPYAVCIRKKYVVGCSNPSFELWGILHFEHTTSQMNQHQAEKRLQKLWPEYKKAMPDIYEQLQEKTGTACQNALKLDEHHKTVSTQNRWECNPITDIHRILEELDKAFPQ